MKNLIRSALGAFGIELRLQSRLREAYVEEKRLATIRPWKQLQRYNPSTILDIGANDGHSVRVFRELMPDVTIHSFEPLEDCFQQVQAELQKNPPGKAHHFALGDCEETTVIHRNDYTPSSSLLPMDQLHRDEFPKSANTREEQIQVRRLDDVAPDLKLDGPIVAKIDVQGFEDRVIRGGEKTFDNVMAIVVELSSYPLYEGQPSFADVHDQLDQLGFVFRGTVDQMFSPNDGRILQFDGLFENRRLADQSQTPPAERVQQEVTA